MKNFLTKVALAVVFCLIVGYTVYQAQNKNEYLSDAMLENIEALAQDENIDTFSKVECKTESTWDPENRIYVETVTKICTGTGTLSCDC